MKIKLFSGIKKCSDNESYKFHDGVAMVPGVRICRSPVLISLGEFRKLQRDEISESELITLAYPDLVQKGEMTGGTK